MEQIKTKKFKERDREAIFVLMWTGAHHAGRGEKQEWVFMETINLLKCHNEKRVAVTNRASELRAAKPIQRMTVYQKERLVKRK